MERFVFVSSSFWPLRLIECRLQNSLYFLRIQVPTREQSNKRSGTRLKTESETGERPYGRVRLVRFARVRLFRHALPFFLLIFSGACNTSTLKDFWNYGVFSLFQAFRDHVTSLDQTVVPHHDYFSAQFLLQFSTQSIYHVTVSSRVIDSSGILWTTGSQNTLQVKTTDSASRKQRTSRS